MRTRAAILAIGDEVLDGRVLNSNAGFFSQELEKIGVSVETHLVVPDRIHRICDALVYLEKNHELILISGGLGPTTDDLTSTALASWMGVEEEMDPEALSEIQAKYLSKGIKPKDNQKRQAERPVGSQWILNKTGMAPGLWIERDQSLVVSLPGVPSECLPMLEEEVLPRLRSHFNLETGQSETMWRIFGLTESDLDSLLKPIFLEVQKISSLHLSYRIKFPELQVKLAYKPEEREKSDKKGEKKVYISSADAITKLTSPYCFARDEKTEFSEWVLSLLRGQKLKIACAESCTGGLLAKLLTDISGSSEVFERGVVTYSNESKVALLGVNPETLEKYGAVSQETALEMVEGLKRNSRADINLSVTGIAGPSGGTLEKPVGTVYVGISYMSQSEVKCFKLRFDRERNRVLSAYLALDMVASLFRSGKLQAREDLHSI